jgi:hypothetical protein
VQVVRELVVKPQVVLAQILFLVQLLRLVAVVVAEVMVETMRQQEAPEAGLTVTYRQQKREQVDKVSPGAFNQTVVGAAVVVAELVNWAVMLQGQTAHQT